MLFPFEMIKLAWQCDYHPDVMAIIKDKYFPHLLPGYRVMYVMGFVFYLWAMASLIFLVCNYFIFQKFFISYIAFSLIFAVLAEFFASWVWGIMIQYHLLAREEQERRESNRQNIASG